VIAASSRVTRSETWPVTGSLRSALELLDRGAGLGIEDAGRLELAVAVF